MRHTNRNRDCIVIHFGSRKVLPIENRFQRLKLSADNASFPQPLSAKQERPKGSEAERQRKHQNFHFSMNSFDPEILLIGFSSPACLSDNIKVASFGVRPNRRAKREIVES
eukprot:CCRYP_013831-RE/>CCRYP_013831-RE protein AED:0.49 eAED:0.85 QI:0/0/0/1/0/0/2/0/110